MPQDVQPKCVCKKRSKACVAGLMEQLVAQLRAMQQRTKSKTKRKSKEEAPAAEAGGGSNKMLAGLLRKVLESFRPIVRLTNVHIRYEDLGPDASSPMALGWLINSQ